MFVVGLSFVVCIVGLVVYLLCSPPNTKGTELGRLMFFAGLLATLLQSSNLKL